MHDVASELAQLRSKDVEKRLARTSLGGVLPEFKRNCKKFKEGLRGKKGYGTRPDSSTPPKRHRGWWTTVWCESTNL